MYVAWSSIHIINVQNKTLNDMLSGTSNAIEKGYHVFTIAIIAYDRLSDYICFRYMRGMSHVTCRYQGTGECSSHEYRYSEAKG
jgi:hypothetical protein